MDTYRIRAYRRQLVEILITATDDEWAWEYAIDAPAHDWDVIETLDVEDADSITLAAPCHKDDPNWEN